MNDHPRAVDGGPRRHRVPGVTPARLPRRPSRVRKHRWYCDHGPVPRPQGRRRILRRRTTTRWDHPTRFNTRAYTLWLPALGEPGRYTERGRRFDSVVKHLFGGDLPLRLQGLRQRYVANMLVAAEASGPLGRARSTLGIRYHIDPGLGVSEDELNRDIRRFAPAPGARSRAADPVFAEMTGRITVPVLAIHETGDARVPFSLQQAYRRRTLAAGTAHLLVQRAVRWGGHCAFDGEVREQAFDDLVAWIERGVKPDGDDLLASDVSKLGLRWTRILHPDDPAR